MSKENKMTKVKNPTQKKVCIYSWRQNIDRSVIFEMSGRASSPVYKNKRSYYSYTRHVKYADLISNCNGMRICLKKIR